MGRLLTVYNKWTAYDLWLPMGPSTTSGVVGVMRWLKMEHCPMCSGSIGTEKLPVSLYGNSWDEDSINGNVLTQLHSCNDCGWWGIRERGEDSSFILPTREKDWDRLISGILQKWDASAKSTPVNVLLKYLRRRELFLREIHPFAFEKIIAECLRIEFGPCDVWHVGSNGGRGDGGIDVFVVKDGVDWLVQVKRRSSDSAESVDAVRMLNGVLLREGKTHGMVITTAPRFTKVAQSESHPKAAGAYVVKLLCRPDVLRMIDITAEDRYEAPWYAALDDSDSWIHPETVPDGMREILGTEETKEFWYPG